MQQASKRDPVVAIQGLRKSYVDRVPSLCLAIYSPPHDKIWFIPGSDKIREVHRDWCNGDRSGSGRKPKPYDEIANNDDVPIRVNVSTEGDTEFDRTWLVDRQSPIDLWKQIHELADRLFGAALKQDALSKLISAWMESPPPEEASEQDNPVAPEQPPK